MVGKEVVTKTKNPNARWGSEKGKIGMHTQKWRHLVGAIAVAIATAVGIGNTVNANTHNAAGGAVTEVQATVDNTQITTPTEALRFTAITPISGSLTEQVTPNTIVRSVAPDTGANPGDVVCVVAQTIKVPNLLAGTDAINASPPTSTTQANSHNIIANANPTTLDSNVNTTADSTYLAKFNRGATGDELNLPINALQANQNSLNPAMSGVSNTSRFGGAELATTSASLSNGIEST